LLRHFRGKFELQSRGWFCRKEAKRAKKGTEGRREEETGAQRSGAGGSLFPATAMPPRRTRKTRKGFEQELTEASTVAKASTSAKATADEMADRAERVLHKEAKGTKMNIFSRERTQRAQKDGATTNRANAHQ